MKHHSKEKPNAQRSRSRRSKPQDASSTRQKYEHYLALARAEDGNGDPVAAENYYQHAEHYFRAAAGADPSQQPGL